MQHTPSYRYIYIYVCKTHVLRTHLVSVWTTGLRDLAKLGGVAGSGALKDLKPGGPSGPSVGSGPWTADRVGVGKWG